MQHKLTISVDEKIYKGLHKVIGRGNISRFISDLVQPYVGAEKRNRKRYNGSATHKTREKKEDMEDFIELCDRLAEESKRNGMTEEILKSILAEGR